MTNSAKILFLNGRRNIGALTGVPATIGFCHDNKGQVIHHSIYAEMSYETTDQFTPPCLVWQITQIVHKKAEILICV